MFSLRKQLKSIGPGIQRPPVLFQVIPPKSGEFSTQRFINTLEALNLVDDVLSFELVATDNSVLMYVRSSRPDHTLSTLEAGYPQAHFETVAAADDPLLLTGQIGTVYRQALWSGGEQWLPLQVQNDEDGSDPFAEMVGGLSAEIPPGGRVITRVVLSEMDSDWSEEWRHRAITGSGSANQQLADAKRLEDKKAEITALGTSGKSGSSHDLMLYVFVGAFVLITSGFFFQQTILSVWEEHRIELFVYGTLSVLALAGLGYLLHKLGIFSGPPEPKFYDPDQVILRVGGAAFRMEVQLYAMLPGAEVRKEGIERVLRPVVASYQRFDSPMGARFEAGPVERLNGFDPSVDRLGFVGVRRDFLGRVTVGEGVVGTREVVALWHVPGDVVDAPNLVRAGSRRLPAPRQMYVLEDGRRDGAALVGVEKYRDGGLRKMHFPGEVMRRHHLYVARTRMGKSTLMQHVVRNLLRDKAAGINNAALIVVDPHSDLVTDILNGMPVGAASDVRLIDMGDSERACGINLLDVRAFPKRDMTIPSIIAVARASSAENSWGDRMSEIFRWTLIALYEANRNRREDEQYTIFDAGEMLTDETRRQQIIREGRDVDVAHWWYSIYPLLVPRSDRSAIAPVMRKLGEYAGFEAARRVLGQRRCTLDIDEAVRSGKVLLVDTARARSGDDVAAIVGASVLRLVHDVIRRQSMVPVAERRRIIVIVDEMQTLQGVEYDDMLAELGKFGGSLIMATQSLDRLNEMTENRAMREAILANIGALVAFQVDASDAELLRQELRGDILDKQDILDLPPHNCYGKLTLESGNIHFSMELLRPLPGDPGLAELIRQASDAYTRPTVEVDAEHADFMQDRYGKYFDDPDDDTPGC